RFMRSERTDDEGGYRIQLPDVGLAFELSAREDAGRCEVSGIRAGATDVDLVLPPLEVLLFRVVERSSGEPVPVFAILWRPAGEGELVRLPHDVMDEHGDYRARLPAGAIDLMVRANGELRPSFLRGVDVARGEPTRVRFELEQGYALVVEIENGEELPDVSILA